MDGLIYVAIIALWAVFLVGQLLRHHDDVTESRSADRFSTAMRILARRSSPVPDKRYIVKPPPPSGRKTPGRQTFVKGRRTPAAGRIRMLARRRRILLGLLLLFVVTAMLSGLEQLQWWSATVPAGLLGTYAGYLRRQVRRAAAANRRQAAAARSAEARRLRMERLDRMRTARESRELEQPQAAAVDGSVIDGRLAADETADEGWDPRPWPLPTYVTAPAAAPPVRSNRVIDLTSPGAWTEGIAPERMQILDDDPPEEELDEIRARRYVVND